MVPDVSICIATCRRPVGLSRLLASLARAKRPDGVELEVIVVDNDPDASPEVRPDEPPPGLVVRWLREPRRNIALARNRGVDAASGHWLAFVDDDEVVHEGWLEAFWSMPRRFDADAYFGPVLAAAEAPDTAATRWLDVDTFYARERFATGTSIGAAGARTGNAFLRRASLGDARFDPAFGLSGGVDTDLFGRLRERGLRFVWCDEARVDETLPRERHRFGWLVQRAFRGGHVTVRVEAARRGRRAGDVPRAAIGLLGFAVLSVPVLFFSRVRAAQLVLRACTQAGKLWAHAGGRYEEYGD